MKKIILFLGLTALISSCSSPKTTTGSGGSLKGKIPYSTQIEKEYNLTVATYRHQGAQFYTAGASIEALYVDTEITKDIVDGKIIRRRQPIQKSLTVKSGTKMVWSRTEGAYRYYYCDNDGYKREIPFAPSTTHHNVYYFRPPNRKTVKIDNYDFIPAPSSYQTYMVIVIDDKLLKPRKEKINVKGVSVNGGSESDTGGDENGDDTSSPDTPQDPQVDTPQNGNHPKENQQSTTPAPETQPKSADDPW